MVKVRQAHRQLNIHSESETVVSASPEHIRSLSLSIYLSIYLYIYLSIYLSLWVYERVFVCLSSNRSSAVRRQRMQKRSSLPQHSHFKFLLLCCCFCVCALVRVWCTEACMAIEQWVWRMCVRRSYHLKKNEKKKCSCIDNQCVCCVCVYYRDHNRHCWIMNSRKKKE